MIQQMGAAIGVVVLAFLTVPAASSAGFVVGIEFVDEPYYSPVFSTFPADNVFPYTFTDPNHAFNAHGALDGYTEMEVRQAIVAATQDIFRRAEIRRPGQMLDIDIRFGPVDPSVGTVHSIGASGFPLSLFGSAYPTGATFRPDLRPNSVYTNQLSVTFANTVATLPDRSPDAHFLTLEDVVQSIAGTTAQEIAHTLNVWNDVPGDPGPDGTYPIMASGRTGLPIPQRLRERRFLHIPNTQPAHPGPPPGGDNIYSVPETLVNTAGTTSIADFNFDGTVDGSDFQIWMSHRFQTGTNAHTGDANDDGVTDVADFNLWNEARARSTLVPEPPLGTGAMGGLLALWGTNFHRRRRLFSRGKTT